MARDIALCLSGGGYRAAWFNLGVLRKLDDLELLDRIGIISSVSGGSILAGFYATALLNQQPFSEFVEKVTRFLQRRIPLDEPVDTSAASAQYERGMLTVTLPIAARQPTTERVTITIRGRL